MRHDKLEKQLDLMLMLTENRGHTVDQICQRLGMSRRNFYYYIEFFRDCGFHVERRGNGIFTIGRGSPFFRRLIERVSLTEAEVIVIQRLLAGVTERNAVVEALRRKLDGYYDFSILDDNLSDQATSLVVDQLHDAIKFKRMVVLHNYSSPHGRSSRDRLVEPFLLMDGNQEVRCYEPSSAMNKTFKVARIGSVDILDDEWMNEAEHRQMQTDVFMFSADRSVTVELRMGRLSRNLLIEERPRAAAFFTADGNDHWLLRLPLCSYAGIGRFVLGLMEDIEVLGDDGFCEYLRKQVDEMSKRINS